MSFHVTRTPDFSRLRKALLSEGEPDRVPFIELGIAAEIKSKILGRTWRTVADEIEFARTTGYDFIKLQPGIDMNPGKIMPQGGPQTSQLTAEGPTRRWADEHAGVITNREEFERYRWPKPHEIDYSRLEEACRTLPDDMAIIGQYGDIFTFVWESMGFETFCMAIYEDPDLVQALFDAVGSAVYNLYENMITMDRVGALWFSDDLAYANGPMIDPSFFRQYLFPWVRKMGDLCNTRNIPFLYHSDGVLWDMLDDLIACGVTALHPIEPKSMDIGEVKRRVEGKLAVVGSIEVDTLCRGTPKDVGDLVLDRMRRVAPGGGFALGSSNSVPEYADVNNYLAMLEAGDRWGTYPIRLD